VRIVKENQQAKGIHLLPNTEREISQDSKRKIASKRHSHSYKHRERDKSEQQKKASKQGALTTCQAQRERWVRITKEGQEARGTHSLSSTERGISQDRKRSQQARGTHCLLNIEEETSQDRKRKPESKRHSHTVKHRERDKWEQQKKPASKGHSHSVKKRVRDKWGQKNKASKWEAFTPCQTHGERQVRIAKEAQKARGTHILSSIKRETSEDSESKQASKGHSQAVKHRERQVRIVKESQQARSTHSLSST
jgi:hypothetical protein